MVPLMIGFVVATGMALFAHRYSYLNGFFLFVVSALFTVPSIAFYLILLNVTGRGYTTAVVVLTAYTLVLIYRNVTTGLQEVPRDMVDAAEGMGLTRRQILTGIDLPLALPVILTGIRIVLVQAIGLVTVAALIGGGGFGVFIFQGLGQTAMDLVLLGAVPTVFFAFSSAVILDAVADSIRGPTA